VPDRNHPTVTYSDLCGTLTVDGITVDVQIYRLGQDAQWVLEVVNIAGSSTVWDDPFETDRDALSAFEQVVIEEGIETFLDNGNAETLH
jgi:hypothetical protein